MFNFKNKKYYEKIISLYIFLIFQCHFLSFPKSSAWSKRVFIGTRAAAYLKARCKLVICHSPKMARESMTSAITRRITWLQTNFLVSTVHVYARLHLYS